MAGEISTTEQIVEITTTENAVAVTVTDSAVAVTASDIGLQGPTGATGVVDAITPITYNSTTKTIGINDGTTAQKGAVQLTDSVSSTSTTTAATPNSVKTAYDLANTNATAQQVHVYVKNGSGSAMTKGQVVYINSASGANPLIALAQANTEATSSKTLGVLEQDLAVNAFGYVATEGILTGVNTGSASDGDPIWLSGTTAGGMIFGIANKPSAPTHLVFVGYVLRAQQNNGVIYVKPQNGFELEELHNVAISSPTTGQSIVYDSTTSLWNNGAPAPASHASTHASGGSDPVTISPSQQNYPLATAWVSGTTYAVGDVVTHQTGYYVRRVAGAGTTAPNSDTTNWAVRSTAGNLQGASGQTASSLVAYNSTGGVSVQGMVIGTPPATVPSTGLNVSNGSITVSGSTNGISVTGSGGVTTGSGGLTASGGVTATGSSVIQNTGTGGISAGSGGITTTGNITLGNSTTGGTLNLTAASGNIQTIQAQTGANTTLTLRNSSGTVAYTSDTIAVDKGGTGATATTGSGNNVLDTNPTIASLNASGTIYRQIAGAPSAVTTAITATQLLAMWVTSSPATAQSTALPSLTTLNSAWLGGDTAVVEWSFINGGSATITITNGTSHTAPNNGSTGSATISAGTSARFGTRRSSGGVAYITYRLS